MRLLIHWIITAISVAVAILLVPGITVESNAAIAVVVTALVLGLLNVFVRPLLQFLSCGCIVATLGLFLFVINATTLWLSSWICQNWLGIEFIVDGFWPAFWGGVVVSVVSYLLYRFLPAEEQALP